MTESLKANFHVKKSIFNYCKKLKDIFRAFNEISDSKLKDPCIADSLTSITANSKIMKAERVVNEMLRDNKFTFKTDIGEEQYKIVINDHILYQCKKIVRYVIIHKFKINENNDFIYKTQTENEIEKAFQGFSNYKESLKDPEKFNLLKNSSHMRNKQKDLTNNERFIYEDSYCKNVQNSKFIDKSRFQFSDAIANMSIMKFSMLDSTVLNSQSVNNEDSSYDKKIDSEKANLIVTEKITHVESDGESINSNKESDKMSLITEFSSTAFKDEKKQMEKKLLNDTEQLVDVKDPQSKMKETQ